ncbi:MAG: hypothetical protein M3Q42_02600 [Pseudomonadota bacterium]|nr:hypothetical protein [Pseudomonadota bacterium]
MLAAVALKALVIGISILALAVAYGLFREAVLVPRLGTPSALVLSGLLLATLILGIAYLSLPWLGTRQPAYLLGVGLGWFGLTLIFEFSFGLWQGKSWPVMLEACTFKDGNVWPLVLAAVALAPYAAARPRGWL